MARTGAGSVEGGRTPIAGGRRWLFVAASAGTGSIGAATVVLGAWLVLPGGNLCDPVVEVLLWSGRLPAGGQASAMTHVHRGRQDVVINAAGRARLQAAANR